MSCVSTTLSLHFPCPGEGVGWGWMPLKPLLPQGSVDAKRLSEKSRLEDVGRWDDHPITNRLMKRGTPAKSELEETAKQGEKFSHAMRSCPHLSHKGKLIGRQKCLLVRERKNWKEPLEIRNHIDDNHKHSSRVNNQKHPSWWLILHSPNSKLQNIPEQEKKIPIAVFPIIGLFNGKLMKIKGPG